MRVALPVIIVVVIAICLFFFPDSFLPNQNSQVDELAEQTGAANSDSHELDVGLIEEAESYIQDITDKDEATLDIKKVDDFVTQNQSISLSDSPEIEELTLEQLNASGLEGTSPITLIRKQEQIVYKTPANILLDAKGNLDTPIKILEDGKVVDTTVRELLKKYQVNELENIAVIKITEHYVITTLDELNNDQSISPSEPLRIIKKSYRLATTSVGELLMGDTEISADDIFFVRNIEATDQNGIWGIIQNGLLKNFAQGIAIKRGESLEKYQVMIPQDADERLADNYSSFLGRLIQDKSEQSYVYNFEKGRMGRNPDLILPGQEIVIIRFTAEELVRIYQHFVTKTNS